MKDLCLVWQIFLINTMSSFVGNLLGSEDRTEDRARKGTGMIAQKSLLTAADQIAPEELKAMDSAVNEMLGKMINNMQSMEDINLIAALDPFGELDTGADNGSRQLCST